jgi:hypothetical protein
LTWRWVASCVLSKSIESGANIVHRTYPFLLPKQRAFSSAFPDVTQNAGVQQQSRARRFSAMTKFRHVLVAVVNVVRSDC